MKNQHLITIGIPTCYGKESLLKTVDSIIDSGKNILFDFIIVADTVPIEKKMLSKFKKLNITVIENKKPGSQFKKLKQIIKLTKTDLFIFTQDDIVFDSNTIREIIDTFESNKKITMISTNVKSLKSKTIFEHITEIGVNIGYKVGLKWNSGDNYLLANGRCLAFRTYHLKKFYIPEEVVNGDAYLYFENKRRDGFFSHAPNAIVFNPNPSKLSEHINQTSRFQYSKQELSKYFNDLDSEYAIPTKIAFKSVLTQFLIDPIFTFFYLCLFVYSKVNKLPKKILSNTQWKIAISTKRH